MKKLNEMILYFLLLAGLTSLIYAGGGIYSKATFYRGAEIGSWIAPSNTAVGYTTGGAFTNGITYTNYYRVSATNDLGRLPVSAVVTSIWTGTTNASNAVIISWARMDGLNEWIVEYSADNSTWTNWDEVDTGAWATNYTDWGTNVWHTNIFTNIYSVMEAPPVFWGTGNVASITVSGGILTGGGTSGVVDVGLATNALTNALSGLYVETETDPVFTNWLDTNTYVQTESDPIFTNWVSTNEYVKIEADPIFTNWAVNNTNTIVYTNTPTYTNAVVHAESAHSVTTNNGFQGGASASATYGGAVGYSAIATRGGAVGRNAKTGNGFAGGDNAFTTTDGLITRAGIDAIQLGTGGNMVTQSFQVYTYQMMDASGNIPDARMPNVVFTNTPTYTDTVAKAGTAYGWGDWSPSNTAQGLAIALNTAKRTYPIADSNKLAGIASGATSNSIDAFLLSRANHTGNEPTAALTNAFAGAWDGADDWIGTVSGTAAATIESGAAAGATAMQDLVDDTTPDAGGNIRLGSYSLTGDGGTEGLYILSDGKGVFGVGNSSQGFARFESTGGANKYGNIYAAAAGGLTFDTYGYTYPIILNGSTIILQGLSHNNVGIDSAVPDTKLDVNGAITIREKSSDPADPDEGSAVYWMSDGSGFGDDGDIIIKIKAGGIVKTNLWIDFSGL